MDVVMSLRKYNHKSERLTFLLNLELATMKYSNILKGGMWSRLKRVKGIGEKNLGTVGKNDKRGRRRSGRERGNMREIGETEWRAYNAISCGYML